MPNLAFLLKMLKYAPVVIGVVKGLRGSDDGQQQMNEQLHETQRTLDDVRKQLSQRMDDLEQENARLRSRLQDSDASLTTLKVLVWTTALFALFATVLALVAMVR